MEVITSHLLCTAWSPAVYVLYLKMKSYSYSIINSIEIVGTWEVLQEVLKAKQKALKSSGKGAKHAAHTLTDSWRKMLCTKPIGTWNSRTNVGRIVVQEYYPPWREERERTSRPLLGRRSVKRRCIWRWSLSISRVQGATKTRTGDHPCDVRPVKPRMYENKLNKERCPVQLHKEFARRRA